MDVLATHVARHPDEPARVSDFNRLLLDSSGAGAEENSP
jgi:hypothetical protein